MFKNKQNNIFPFEIPQPRGHTPVTLCIDKRWEDKEMHEKTKGKPFSLRWSSSCSSRAGFSSCVRKGCSTWRAPSRRHTSALAAVSSGERRGCRGSWPPWMGPQAPGPGPYRTTKHKHVGITYLWKPRGDLIMKMINNLICISHTCYGQNKLS